MFACLLAVGASYEITKFMLVVLRDFRTARTRVRSIGWICATLFLVGPLVRGPAGRDRRVCARGSCEDLVHMRV